MTITNYQDFGFNSNEFLGNLDTVPYCQFLNASSQNYGIAITNANAELAELELTKGWSIIEHEFSDGTRENLFVTKEPRLLVLNRSQPLMSDEFETIPYNKAKFKSGNYKAFSYLVVWFLDKQNKAISTLPFRLKCSGYAGLTFLKNYSYYNNSNSFTKKFLQVYKNLTGDEASNKNELFYAHAVYHPILTRKKATSSINGQSSFAVMTDSFIEPNESNFSEFIIKNGSELSHKIKEFVSSTKPWLKTESVQLEDSKTPPQQVIEPSSQTDVEAGLVPEPIMF